MRPSGVALAPEGALGRGPPFRCVLGNLKPPLPRPAKKSDIWLVRRQCFILTAPVPALSRNLAVGRCLVALALARIQTSTPTALGANNHSSCT